MKRNNLFMWAYISFIIISIIFRIFLNYTLWTPIVLTITISSIFFAIESLCSSVSNSLKQSLEIFHDFLKEVKSKKDEYEAVFSQIEDSIEKCQKLSYDLSEFTAILEPIGDKLHGTDDLTKDMESTFESYKKSQHRWEKFENIFSYIGFLCLFCILIIASLTAIPQTVQEIVTVITFAVILFTQQIDIMKTERIKEETIASKEALDAFVLCFSGLPENEKQLEKLINNINILYSDTGSDSHAD